MTGFQYLFRNTSVAASTTLNSTNIIDTSSAAKVSIEIKNTGTSTNVTINVNGSLTNDITGYGTLQPITLAANGSAEVYLTDVIPEKLWAQVVNNDASNAAIITVQVLVKPKDIINAQISGSSDSGNISVSGGGMGTVLKSTDYTLDPTPGTVTISGNSINYKGKITLLGELATVTKVQIESISDLDHYKVMWTDKNPGEYQIYVSNGVIYYLYDTTGMDVSDTLKIVVNLN